jgi:hypothetical protein
VWLSSNFSFSKIFKYSKIEGEWGKTITIDSSNMTTKELKASINYYLKSKGYFKPTSSEENVKKYDLKKHFETLAFAVIVIIKYCT